MTKLNGYEEADNIDAQIERVYRETKPLGTDYDNHLHRAEALEAWQREMRRFLRTVSTTCTILLEEMLPPK